MAKPKGLYANINRRKKLGTSRPKSKSTISPENYANMQAGFPKKDKMYGGKMKEDKMYGGKMKEDKMYGGKMDNNKRYGGKMKKNYTYGGGVRPVKV